MGPILLKHHGVKGMKWGVRRDESDSVKIARTQVDNAKASKRKVDKKFILSKQDITNSKNAKRELKYAKEDLSSVKILDKLDKSPKSKIQLELEAKYKAKGLNGNEAAVAAYKNIRTKKILTAVAATAVVAGSAYAGYRIHDHHVDKLIKSGTKLQNVAADNMGVRDAFYSAKGFLDKAKYKGLYGAQLQANKGAVFVKEIKVLSDIRQASPKNAQKILQDLVSNNASFSKDLNDALNAKRPLGDNWRNIAAKARKSLADGKVDKNVYEALNIALVDHSPDMQKVTNSFYGELSKKGYNAIKDVNDNKYSGYKTLNPIIAFDSKGKVEVKDVRELTKNQISKNLTVSLAHISGTQIARDGSVITAALVARRKIPEAVKNRKLNKQVDDYRNENPNTKLSNTEIKRMLERGGGK